jgi:hypothetical protein
MTPRMYHSFMSDSKTAAADCHLLVADLFPAGSSGSALYAGLALPALETLLARGRSSGLAGASLERWLATTFRIAAGPDLPLAALSLLGDGGDPGSGCWLEADPVHLRVHRDQVLLAAAGKLTARESQELIAALNAHFAEDGLEFTAPVPQRWYVRLRDEPRIRTTPTAEAVGQRIESLLPQGEDGARWRRIINEAQMLLHDQPCNEAREARGELPVNSVWLWGAGQLPGIPRDAPYAAVWSSHPLATGIALTSRLQSRALPQSGPQFLEEVGSDSISRAPQLLVLDALRGALGAGLEGWQAALKEIEARWFAPLLDGLKRGQLASLTLHALGSLRGCTVTATRFDPLKFWRAKRGLERYAG